MIYDCFQISNELEILDIRLHELADVVDKFVIVESTVSHACKPKRLYYEENKPQFKQYKNKIIHVIVDETPDVTLPWIVNDYQFCQIKRGLKHCTQSDIILFGDVDEIPRANAILEGRKLPGKLKVFEQDLYQYYLNYKDGPWYGTRMSLYKDFMSYESPWVAKFSKPDTVIPDGGWHFSSIGGVKKIQEKIANMTHQEFNNDRYNTPEQIRRAIRDGKDIFGHGLKFKVTNMESLPYYVQSNIHKFNNLILFEMNISFQSNLLLEVLKYLRLVFRRLRRLLYPNK